MEVQPVIQETVLVTEKLAEIIKETLSEYVVVENNNSNTIVVQNSGNIVAEVNTTSVLLTGLIGPPGVSEEDIMYSKRIDFITDNELYRGEALVGSSETSAVWRIRRILINPDVSEQWASGNANFDKVWADRLSLTYT